MTYPQVLTELETLHMARSGWSVSRYGDGELRICDGGRSISQDGSPKLAAELREILQGKWSRVLPCIPNLDSATPRHTFWSDFRAPRYARLYRPGIYYGSSFITRPDNAPWIDRPEYWNEVRRLWSGRTVAYVGGQRALYDVIKQDAAYADLIEAPLRNAYSEIDSLTRRLLSRPYAAIIISLGAAGTALAARLGRDGAQHALDLGHIGMFMQNPGAFSFAADDLTSPTYRQLLRQAHATTGWGRGGHNFAPDIAALAKRLGAADVLDYGCGGGTLKPALKALGVKCLEYDPGVIGKDIPPKLADVVASTDVFEHIEPELVDNVLRHTFALARKGAFFAIAKQPAKKILADGRNAHLTCRPTEWWIDRLVAAGWERDKITIKADAWKKCALELVK